MRHDEIFLSIEGMSCSSCVRHVREALFELKGVSEVDVDLAKGKARVRHEPQKVSVAQLIDSLREAGYDSTLAKIE